MSKPIWEIPTSLQNLLAELEVNHFTANARLVLNNEELGILTLTGENVAKVLQSIDTVDQFFESIDQTEDCMVEIEGCDIEPEIQERLEDLFEYVEIV